MFVQQIRYQWFAYRRRCVGRVDSLQQSSSGATNFVGSVYSRNTNLKKLNVFVLASLK